MPNPAIPERIAKKIEHSPDGCWLWMGGRYGNGYGQLWPGGDRRAQSVRAHRYVYEAHVGAIPEGLILMHTCDVRHCVNPDHLRPGTQLENIEDSISKGRYWVTRGKRTSLGRFTN